MRESRFKSPKTVLVFSGSRVLNAAFRSLHTAATMTGANLQAVSFACTGRYISTGGYYYRHLHPDIIISMQDFGTLTLEEYDQLCGIPRKYHTVRQMAKRRKTKKM